MTGQGIVCPGRDLLFDYQGTKLAFLSKLERSAKIPETSPDVNEFFPNDIKGLGVFLRLSQGSSLGVFDRIVLPDLQSLPRLPTVAGVSL